MPGFNHELADTAKVVWAWTGPDGVQARNIHYIKWATATLDIESILQEVADNVYYALTTPTNCIIDKLSHLWTLDNVTAFQNDGSGEALASHSGPATGGVTADPLPPGVALVISWVIGASYRGGHPRTYVPGFPLNNLDTAGGNRISAGSATNLNTAAGIFLSNVYHTETAASGYRAGTIAASRGGTQLVPPVFYAYSSSRVNTRLDSQRRRNGKS